MKHTAPDWPDLPDDLSAALMDFELAVALVVAAKVIDPDASHNPAERVTRNGNLGIMRGALYCCLLRHLRPAAYRDIFPAPEEVAELRRLLFQENKTDD